MKSVIRNPILRGFNPDPSIVRVEEDYFIATSTFEWFPGVQIHHSKDLKNWKLIGRPLDRVSQLDLVGVPDSCGVWAPCLSFHEGVFYLVYSNVRSFDGPWKDTPNFLVTARDIRGPWSEPVALGSYGFDGSLFHDDDGRKWFLSMLVDHRKGVFFGGIALQEFNVDTQRLTGPTKNIFSGTELGTTEAPHVYKRDGYYYLMTAEGGTEFEHAASLCRSRSIDGPYEVHPDNPILTSVGDPHRELQKSGHADIVQAANGDWYVVFLTARPLSPHGRCTLGRETSIEELDWPVGEWPRLKNGTRHPRIQIPAPNFAPAVVEDVDEPTTVHDDFDSLELGLEFQSLRIPIEESWCSLADRSGFLRLKGRESLSSLFRQSMIARRVQDFNVQVSTCVEFAPTSYQQMAGLVFFYNTYHWHYLQVTANDSSSRVLQVMTCDKHLVSEPLNDGIELSDTGPVYLRGEFKKAEIQFSYSLDGIQWRPAGPVLDGSILSDDYVRDEGNRYRPAFTGSFVGLCCQDLTGHEIHADFDWFEYREMRQS